MRTKVILGFVVGLLLCSLSTLEVPEFLSLSNDTSNDYSLVSTQEDPTLMVERQVSSRIEGDVVPARASAQVRRDPPVDQVSGRDSVKTGDNLLHSLCILRT